MYHMLLSAGGFAMYRAETHVFNSLAPRFGDLRLRHNRMAMLDAFVRSDMFRVSGLAESGFRRAIDERCSSAGDFLRLFMEGVAATQGVSRWAETTPVHVTYIPEIKASIPDALFVHVIRDGRDVAVSMAKQQWISPLPMDRGTPELAAGAFWLWVVTTGHRLGNAVGRDYLAIRYEDLVGQPQSTLDQVGAFIGQRLDYAEILRVGVGSVSKPNTSFPGRAGAFSGRWREGLDNGMARKLEALLEPALLAHQYTVDTPLTVADRRGAQARRAAYLAWFGARHVLKRTSLGRRYVSLALFEPGAVKSPEEKPPD